MSKIKCEICEVSMIGTSIFYRQNAKGVTGIWRCWKCNTNPIDPLVEEIVTTIAGDNNE